MSWADRFGASHRLRVTALQAVLLLASPQIGSLPALAQAGADVKIAVAANFAEPAKRISSLFESATGYRVITSFGSTGQLYAQISQGAPFEVLVSADRATPSKAVEQGHAIAGTQFTYAIGRLVLFSPSLSLENGPAVLKGGTFSKIAIANPGTAPYGVAAVETMKALGVHDGLKDKIVQGNNISQTFQFIETRNAELGFVALSQITQIKEGSRWIVPADLHTPIAQDAVQLTIGRDRPAAVAFLAYLRGSEARAVIEAFGYGISE